MADSEEDVSFFFQRESTMDQRLLKALRRGDKDLFIRLASQNPLSLSTGRSPQGNTILHIAARLGNKSLVEELLRIRPSLVIERNYKGETPIHIAATAGNAAIVKVMMTARNENQPENSILRLADNESNTPLHNAVRNGHLDLVQKFIGADPSLVFYKNGAGQSPLSIAIDAGSTDIARWIICKDPNSVNPTRTNQRTLLHSAVIRQDVVVTVEMLKANKGLIQELDEHKRNVLHYAAATGNPKMARHLLEENASLAYQRDRNGQTPMHLASGNGQLSVLKMLHNYSPDAIELFDKRRRNILHLAAQYGKVNIIEFVSSLPEMEQLINSPDKQGNTPLHLAAMYLRSDVVYLLSINAKVNINATNVRNENALVIAQSLENHQEREIQKHLTIKALKAAYADRALNAKEILGNTGFIGVEYRTGPDDQKGKGMAKTLSLMATLIATFTFTAAFTIPGGYNNDGPDEGMATLVRKASFQAFVVTDTIAMTSSMTAAVVVFWSFWHSKSETFMDALPLAIFLTWIGLLSMAAAFVTGLFVVLSNNMALAIVACAIGCVLPVIFYVFTPFFSLLLSQSATSQDQVEVNPFAFSLRMLKIILKKPLKWCVGRWR